MTKTVVLGVRPAENFNVLVVGEDGSGKTTFFSSLLRNYTSCPPAVEEIQFSDVIRASGTCSIGAECSMNIRESKNYGDCRDYAKQILQIKAELVQYHRDWNSKQWNMISEEALKASDKRIHCVFYLIEPHHLKHRDIFFLDEISQVATIVPVIVKADAMTLVERWGHLLRIAEAVEEIQRHREGDRPVIFSFDEEVPPDGVPSKLSPFINHDHESRNIALPAEPCPASANTASKEHELEKSYLNVAPPGDSSDGCDTTAPAGSESVELEESAASGMTYSHSSAPSVQSATAFASAYTTSSDEEESRQPQQERAIDLTEDDQQDNTQQLQQQQDELLRLPNIFAVICSADSSGIRSYPWGSVSSEDESTNDFTRLKKLIFESGKICVLRRLTEKISIDLAKATSTTSYGTAGTSVGFNSDGVCMHHDSTAINNAPATCKEVKLGDSWDTSVSGRRRILPMHVSGNEEPLLAHNLSCAQAVSVPAATATAADSNATTTTAADTTAADTTAAAAAAATAGGMWSLADSVGTFLRHPFSTLSQETAITAARSSRDILAADPTSAVYGTMLNGCANLPVAPTLLSAFIITMLLYSPVRTLEWMWTTVSHVASEMWQAPWYMQMLAVYLLLFALACRVLLLK